MIAVELGATAFWIVLGLGVLSGIASVAVFRRLTNRDEMRAATNRILAHLVEFRLFADEPAVIWRAQRDILAANALFLQQAALPSLALLLPFALLLTAADAYFGHAALKQGQSTVVTATPASAPGSALPAMLLRTPADITVETPAVRIEKERQVSWRVRPMRAVCGELEVLSSGHAVEKTICAEPGLHWISDRRTSMAAFLLHPFERPFADPAISSIRVLYPTATIFHITWLVWFFVGSLLGAGATKLVS